MRILRLLASHSLPCGCLARVYESYTGEVIALLDAQDAGCGTRGHREGVAVPFHSAAATSGSSATSPELRG
jgi:hypothetical protein